MLTCIDLFSGCGGLSLGFKNAGFKILVALDNWDRAVNIYNRNFDDHKAILHDISDITETIKIIEQFNPDVIIGGPPCQDFSSAGHRNEDFGRAQQSINFANIVCKYLPNFFMMENVDRITKSSTIEKVREIFINSGYILHEIILDASYFQVPQKRKRFFMFGSRCGDISNLIDDNIELYRAKQQMTIRDYFGCSLNLDYYYRHPRSYNRRAIFSIDEPSPTIRGVNRPKPETYNLHPGDQISIDKLHTIRALTTKERSQIQTFPESFDLSDTKTNIEQMIGNAVPVNLAKFVGLIFQNAINKLLSVNKFDNVYNDLFN